MADSTEDRVVQLIAQVLQQDANTISRNSRFIEDLDIDSIDLVEIVSLVQGEFKKKISEDEIDKFTTVGDVIDFVEGKR